MNDQNVINALIKRDPLAFWERGFRELHPGDTYAHNWHVDAIIFAFMLVMNRKTRRLLVTMPPRQLKSMLLSVALPAFWMGNDPTLKIITSSYGHKLSDHHSYLSRRLMMTDWYRRAFPDAVLAKSKQAVDHFATNLGGQRFTTSVPTGPTGHGADLIIYDDPLQATTLPSMKELDNAYNHLKSSLISRLNNKETGAIIVVQQRTHERDVAGRLIEEGGWTHLDLPAIAEEEDHIRVGENKTYHRLKGEALHPEREPLHELQRLEAELGSRIFSAQYQQRPTPAGGGMVRWNWFRRYDNLPNNGRGGFIVQSWDTAMGISNSGCYSVCTTWSCWDGNAYLIDIWRKRVSSAELPRGRASARPQLQSRSCSY
jgi:hypothetical protein